MTFKKKLLATLALFTFPAALLAQPAQAPQAAAPAQAQAQTQAPRRDANPALWVVRDEDTTIYLFGTFHLLDGRLDWFNDEVREAFDRSSELVLEIVQPSDPAAVQQTVMRYALAAGDRPLSQRLPADLNERLNSQLSAIGVPAGAFERLDPWFVSTTLAVVGIQRLGFSGEQGAEAILTAAARERDMAVRELETMEMQLEMFDNMPEPMQVAQLRSTVEQMDRLSEVLQPMVDAWATGEIDRLAAIMNESMASDPELYRILLTDRNAAWAEWIQQRLQQPGTVFVAVGAGHLGGQGSVQDYLARRGITTSRVAASGTAAPPAAYPPCRSRSDDRCRQRR